MSIYQEIQMAIFRYCMMLQSHGRVRWQSYTYCVCGYGLELTQSKVKVKVTGLLNFRQLAKLCTLAAMTAAPLWGFLVAVMLFVFHQSFVAAVALLFVTDFYWPLQLHCLQTVCMEQAVCISLFTGTCVALIQMSAEGTPVPALILCCWQPSHVPPTYFQTNLPTRVSSCSILTCTTRSA